MKNFVKFLSLMAASMMIFAACGRWNSAASTGYGSVSAGTYVDKVVYLVSTDQTVALKDVVEGRADIMFNAVPPAILSKLSNEEREKLEFYSAPSGYWSLLFNPIPNEAPYVFKTKKGEEIFNPAAVKEIRYAFNWLINRKKLVNDILLGEGYPMYTPFIAGRPDTYRYNALAVKMGMNETGNEKKALNMIEDAMKKAQELPENEGKLVKEDGRWMYNGKPVTMKSLMRIDDPNGLFPLAVYINEQIEKAGFTVESFEHSRNTASSIVYGRDPAEYNWSFYLENRETGRMYSTLERHISGIYAPFFGNMPGGGIEGFWNYKNDKLDDYGKKAVYGGYLTSESFFNALEEMCVLGMNDAVRIHIAVKNNFFVANKSRFNSRLFYGPADGFNGWTIRFADVKPDKDGINKGKKVLRVLQFSSKDSLFMSEWNPIGIQGFKDRYSLAFTGVLTDEGYFDNPVARNTEFAMFPVDFSNAAFSPKLVASGKKDENGDDDFIMGGDILVPDDAVVYDTALKKWVPADTAEKAASAATGRLASGYYWHHGFPVDINDVRYALAFAYEWAFKDGEKDPYYDRPLSNITLPALKTIKGVKFNTDGSFTTYSNYFYAPDRENTAVRVGSLTIKAGNPDIKTSVPWEIYEALSEMVVKGARSGIAYSFDKNGGGIGVEVSLKSPDCLSDIKAKLQEFIAVKHIPASLRDFVTENYVIQRYKASIDFIEKYGNAYISTGPLMFERIEPTTSSVILTGFDRYPYDKEHFPNSFRMDLTTIDSIRAPAAPFAGRDAVFEVNVSKYNYPDGEKKDLDDGKVEGRIYLASGEEKIYHAKVLGRGRFIITVPGYDLTSFEKGIEYEMIVSSSIANEQPSYKSVSFKVLK